MLLKEEKLILRWLSQYGTLTKKQLVALLHEKSPDTVGRIISNLIRARRIFKLNGGTYLGSDPIGEIDQRMVTAVWILTEFIQSVSPEAHYPADFPSQLFFLKESTGYEVVVIYEHEEHLIRQLRPRENMKYIIVVPDIGMVSRLILPDAPCLFATVEPAPFNEVNITFYSEEEAINGQV